MFPTPSQPGAARRIRQLALPDGLWTDIINSLLSDALNPTLYEHESGLTVDETVAEMSRIWLDYTQTGRVGMIVIVRDTAVPPNVLRCDGVEHSRLDYPALYDVLPSSLLTNEQYFVTPDLAGLEFVNARGELLVHGIIAL